MLQSQLLRAKIVMKHTTRYKWRDAATIILSAKHNTDSSPCWIDLFQSIDPQFVHQFIRVCITQSDGKRSPMFTTDKAKSLNQLPAEVSFRICALREMFEESGILLSCQKSSDLKNNERLANMFCFSSLDEIEFWRKLVRRNASAFMDLFLCFRCVPDIWALHEWSNWLTPSEAITKFAKRYDTVFYKAFVQSKPLIFKHDQEEVTKIIWQSPLDIIQAESKKEIQLGPPQIYELRRLLNFQKFVDLLRFTVNRSLKGMERWLPILATTIDGQLIMVYPGDRFYPQKRITSGEGKVFRIYYTYKEILAIQPPTLNHGKISRDFQYKVVCNYTPPYGHVQAVDWNFN